MLAGIGFGVAPMWQRTGGSLAGLLRESGRAGSGSRRHTPRAMRSSSARLRSR
jgi:hypothetical protein